MNMQLGGGSEEWLAWLVGTDAELRKEAQRRLGGLTPSDAVALTPLFAGLKSENETVVFWCLVALGRMKQSARSSLADITEFARLHPAFGIRQQAIAAASQIGPSDDSVRTALLDSLKDASPFVRREALQALINMRNLRREDYGVIRSLSTDPDPTVVRWSEIALRNLGIRDAEV